MTYYDGSGRSVARDEACDARGVVRDGYSIRVSIAMMDSATPPATTPDSAPLNAFQTRDSGYADKAADGLNSWRYAADGTGEARRDHATPLTAGVTQDERDRKALTAGDPNAWRRSQPLQGASQ